MSDPRESVLRIYEGAIRALDTKAQIFLALLTITVGPLAARFAAAELPLWVRALQAAFFCAAALLFILCLFPRSGPRGQGVIFNLSRTPEQVRAHVSDPGFVLDFGESAGVLHGIYLAKRRRMREGIIVLGVYVAALSTVLVLP